jgi:hypothetical protein
MVERRDQGDLTADDDDYANEEARVSKNVSKGVVPQLAVVVPVLACVASKNGYF